MNKIDLIIVVLDGITNGNYNPRLAIEALEAALAQPEQKKESTVCAVDPRLLLGKSNNFTKKTENRLCDIERRLAAIETQPALAQPEPVAWLLPDYGDVLSASEADGTGIYNIPLYTTPPRKPWVGLTDEQLSETYNDLYTQYTRDDVNIVDFILIAHTIESQLKEKNGAT